MSSNTKVGFESGKSGVVWLLEKERKKERIVVVMGVLGGGAERVSLKRRRWCKAVVRMTRGWTIKRWEATEDSGKRGHFSVKRVQFRY